MPKKELNTLKKWLRETRYLIGVILLYLMVSLVILSYPLVVFIVVIRESVGQMIIKGKVSGSFNMQKVNDIWCRLVRSLMFKK